MEFCKTTSEDFRNLYPLVGDTYMPSHIPNKLRQKKKEEEAIQEPNAFTE